MSCRSGKRSLSECRERAKGCVALPEPLPYVHTERVVKKNMGLMNFGINKTMFVMCLQRVRRTEIFFKICIRVGPFGLYAHRKNVYTLDMRCLCMWYNNIHKSNIKKYPRSSVVYYGRELIQHSCLAFFLYACSCTTFIVRDAHGVLLFSMIVYWLEIVRNKTVRITWRSSCADYACECMWIHWQRMWTFKEKTSQVKTITIFL